MCMTGMAWPVAWCSRADAVQWLCSKSSTIHTRGKCSGSGQLGITSRVRETAMHAAGNNNSTADKSLPAALCKTMSCLTMRATSYLGIDSLHWDRGVIMPIALTDDVSRFLVHKSSVGLATAASPERLSPTLCMRMQTMRRLTESRPVDTSRQEFFTDAEIFACIATFHLVAASGGTPVHAPLFPLQPQLCLATASLLADTQVVRVSSKYADAPRRCKTDTVPGSVRLSPHAAQY